MEFRQLIKVIILIILTLFIISGLALIIITPITDQLYNYYIIDEVLFVIAFICIMFWGKIKMLFSKKHKQIKVKTFEVNISKPLIHIENEPLDIDEQPKIPNKKSFEETINKNKIIKTKNGLMVQSMGEMKIANFLFDNKIDYEYDKQLTFEAKGKNINGFTTSWERPDFYLTEFNFIIEYWGLKGTPDYDKKMEEKKRVYMESKTPFISIEPKNLNNLEEVLSTKLKRLGVNL